MRKITVILFLAWFLTPAAWGKDKQPPPKPLTADDIVAKMTKQLGLNDEQTVEVKPIVENYLEQEKQNKLDEKNTLKKVLTPQQLFTWNFLENDPPPDKKHKL